MPRGSSSENTNIHSDSREAHETSTSTINSLGSVRSNQTADYIGSEQSDLPNDRDYSNIAIPSEPCKNIIFSKYFNSTNTSSRANYSTYENLCSGCGYGVFEARGNLCNFCQYVINGYLEDTSNSNIYENICDKCSQVYGGGECSLCSKNNKVNRKDKVCEIVSSNNNKSTSKKLKKRIFHSLLGSLKRVKSFNVPANSVTNDKVPVKGPTRKLEIVHNVDGYDNVFRTNETFDLNRICELKRLKSSTSDHHIYGKLRQSDDHLQTPYECVKQKSQSDDYLIGVNGNASSIFGSTSINSADSIDNNSPLSYLLRHTLHGGISEWVTSLRGETHDYYSFGAPDSGTCNPKSIPASFIGAQLTLEQQTFGVASSLGFSTDHTFDDRWMTSDGFAELVNLRSLSDESKNFDLAQQMVNKFKRNLMEKRQARTSAQHLRSRRQGIYLNLDGIESKQPTCTSTSMSTSMSTSNYHVNLVRDHPSDHNILSPQSLPAQTQAIPPIELKLTAGSDHSQRGAVHQLNKRCCIYQKDSDFVNDILQAFDSFLLRGTEADEQVLESDQSEVVLVQENSLHHQVSHVRESEQSDFNSVSILVREIDIYKITLQLEISKSLNRIVINYDLPLKVFLSAVEKSAHLSQLIFRKQFKIFRRFRVFLLRKICTVTVTGSGNCIETSSFVSNQNKIIPQIDCIPEKKGTPSHSDLKNHSNLLHSITMTVPNGNIITQTKEKENDDALEDEEPIYQPIWKFKTVGEVQENYTNDEYYDHLPRTCDSSASIEGVNIEDHDEWEPDDEFTFTTKLSGSSKEMDTLSVNTTQSASGSTITGYDSSVSTMTLESMTSLTHHILRNICIIYSLKEPKIRAVLYEYDRNRCLSYFAQQPPLNQTGQAATTSPHTDHSRSPCELSNCVANKSKLKKSSESGGQFIADSVQAWKYMLLDANYLEDEEDMFVLESEILKAQTVKEMDSLPPPSGLIKRYKSSGNLTDGPAEEDKKSITERVRNKLQRGVFKLQTRSPKENKKNRSRRNEATSLYLEDGMKPKYPIFKAPLEFLEMNETSYPDVPRFVVDCVEYIEQKDCIQMDGLYRASGNKVAVDELKQKLTESYIYDPKLLVTDDIHTLTSLLKQFFRELGSPLITEETYQKLSSLKNLMQPPSIDCMKTAFEQMRNPNRATLKFLIKHLTTVAYYSNENRMPPSNLAIVWGPCLLSTNQIQYDIARMNTLAKVLIENYDRIFGDNERLVS